MADTTQTVVLQVKLDEGATEQQLKQLVLDIEKTKLAQQDLNAARKAGTVADEQFAAETVRLKTELKAQQVEQTALTKNLELYRTATGALGDTYKGTQAQLSLAQRQYQELQGSQNNSTESTQALTDVIDGLRNTLKATDAQQSLFVRNIGNYPDGKELTGLVQQMVKLQEEQKNLAVGSKELADNQIRISGFQTQAMQAAAREGKSYQETTNLIKEYSAAIRPAVANLVALEQEQQAVTESGHATEEQVRKIGFQMAVLDREIKAIPPESKKLSTGLVDAAKNSDVLGGAVGRVSAAKEKFTQATNLAKLAIGGEVTALGALRLALIATGLGALVVVLGSVVVFLTKTAEGTQLVENVMARVGAVVNVVTDRLGALGKAVVQVLSGDFSGAANTARRAMAGIGDEMSREVKIAGDLSKARQQLDRDTANNIDTNKRLLNEVERLKNVRDNEFNTLQVRKKANEDAYAVELTRERTLADLARRRIAILKGEIDQRGGASKVSLEQLKEYKEAQNELSDILEDAAGKQNELITNRFNLSKEGLDAAEAARKKLDDAMLKSIEADIAAGLSREAAAKKFLDDQLAGDQLRLESAKKTRDEKKTADLAAYTADVAMLERSLEQRRLVIEKAAAQERIQRGEADRQLRAIEAGGLAARLLLTTRYNQDTTEVVHSLAEYEIAEAARVTAQKKKNKETEHAIEEAAFQASATTTDLIIELFGKESAAGQEALLIKKTLAIAEVAINTEKLLIANGEAGAKISAEAPPYTVPLGIAYTVATDAAAIAAAAASISQILSYRQGGVLSGPSHEQGGIPFTVNGRPGFEAEGNEVILTKGVWNNPLLRPLASTLNMLGGGAPLMPRAHMALGGVTASSVATQFRGDVSSLSPQAVAKALGQELRKNPPVNQWVDFKAAQARNQFTDAQAND